jgi:hypothetical protein
MAGCATSEIALTKDVLPSLVSGMLCLADRNFFGYGATCKTPAAGRVGGAFSFCGEGLPMDILA